MSQRKYIYYCLTIVLLLCACSKEPIASNKAISNAKKAIEIGEDYLSGDISSKDAHSQLENIEDAMSYAFDYELSEYSDDPRKSADRNIYLKISSLSVNIFLDGGLTQDAESYDKVQETLNSLKDILKKYD